MHHVQYNISYNYFIFKIGILIFVMDLDSHFNHLPVTAKISNLEMKSVDQKAVKKDSEDIRLTDLKKFCC